jgi:phage regulator Rha-like protein
MNKQLENRISSREVAEMMEVQHKDLLKKIEGINVDLQSEKVRSDKYWVEGTYKAGTGKSYKEFQITKRGCEFLAHKTTGTKGNLFTDKYMDRFEQMKTVIENNIAPKTIDTSKEKEIEAKYNNSLVRKSNLLLKIAGINPNLPKEYVQVLQSKAAEILTGDKLIPLPKVEKKTYTATEIGQILGVSSNKVGRLAKDNNLKNEKYGIEVWDKSRYSNKEVPSFRYYEDVIPVLKELV